MQEFKPVKDRILLLPEEKTEEVSAGGIFLGAPDETPCRGRIVAIGPEVSEYPLEVEDLVAYRNYAGVDVELNGIRHLVLEESDILGVLCQT